MLCKAQAERVAVVGPGVSADTRYEDLGIYGDICGPTMTLDETYGMFFHVSAESLRRRLVSLRTLSCRAADDDGSAEVEAALAVAASAALVPAPAPPSQGPGGRAARAATAASTASLPPSCGATGFRSLDELSEHLRSAHTRHVCALCAAHRAVWPQELPRLTAAQLNEHCRRGEPAVGFAGHPPCNFCGTRFFSDTERFAHLNQEHLACHLCTRADGAPRQEYFNAYGDLDAHFIREHYACRNAACLERKFVVFATPLELSAHAAAEHGANADVTSQLAFRFEERSARRAAAAIAIANDPDDGGLSDAIRASLEAGGGDAAADAAAAPAAPPAVLTAADFPSLDTRGRLPPLQTTSIGGGAAARRLRGNALTTALDAAFPDLSPRSSSAVGGAAAPTVAPRAAGGGGGAGHLHRAIAAAEAAAVERAVIGGGSSAPSSPRHALTAEHFPVLPAAVDDDESGSGGGGGGGGSRWIAAAARPNYSSNRRVHSYASLDSLLRMSGQGHVLAGGGPRAPVAQPPVPGMVYITSAPARDSHRNATAGAPPRAAASAAPARAAAAAAPSAAPTLRAAAPAAPAPAPAPAASAASEPPPRAASASHAPAIAAAAPVVAGPPASAQLAAALAGSPGAFEAFREASAAFRAGGDASEYHSLVSAMFAAAKPASPAAPPPVAVFAAVFPALISQLPDAAARARLAAVHAAWLQPPSRRVVAPAPAPTSAPASAPIPAAAASRPASAPGPAPTTAAAGEEERRAPAFSLTAQQSIAASLDRLTIGDAGGSAGASVGTSAWSGRPHAVAAAPTSTARTVVKQRGRGDAVFRGAGDLDRLIASAGGGSGAPSKAPAVKPAAALDGDDALLGGLGGRRSKK